MDDLVKMRNLLAQALDTLKSIEVSDSAREMRQLAELAFADLSQSLSSNDSPASSVVLENSAWQVMASAHALCPSEQPHLDKMRWMASYFLDHHKPGSDSKTIPAPVGYFVKHSSFGPWVECERGTLHAQRFYASPVLAQEPVKYELRTCVGSQCDE